MKKGVTLTTERNKEIKKRYKELRETTSAGEAIDIITEEWNNVVQFDTIRSIVYRKEPKEQLENNNGKAE